MKRGLSASLVALVLVTGFAAGPLQPAAAAECTPRIELLARLEDGRVPANYGADTVNALGGRGRLAVGQTDGRPAYWQDGKLKLVPLPAGYRHGEVVDVNAFGLMVGVVEGIDSQSQSRAFRYWTGQRSIDFTPRGVRPGGINDDGRVVVEGGDGTALEYWHGTQVRRTLRVPGAGSITPTAINNAGQVVGVASRETAEAVSWPADVAVPGRPMAPLTDPDLNRYVVADIDQRGRAVGFQQFASTNGVYRTNGLYWSSVTDPTPDSIPDFVGHSISPTTKVVAGSNGSNGLAAVIWRGSGRPILLPVPASTTFSRAYAIDDDGRVGGQTYAKDRGYPTVWHCTQRLPATG